MRDLGIVIPTYKESRNISALVSAILKRRPSARIVVVDDSPDAATAQAAEAMRLPNVEVIRRRRKGGRGSAVLDGIRRLLQSDCRRILEMDSDFSHSPDQIPELEREAEAQSADLLIASRYLGPSRIENWPLRRRLFSRFSNALARALLGVPVSDYTNGYRIYSRRAAKLAAQRCGQFGTGFVALSEILLTLHMRGMRIREVPTVFVNRVRGESSVTMREILNAMAGLLRLFAYKRGFLRAGRAQPLSLDSAGIRP